MHIEEDIDFINHLPPDEALIYLYRVYLGKSPQYIAKHRKVPPSFVKMKLHKIKSFYAKQAKCQHDIIIELLQDIILECRLDGFFDTKKQYFEGVEYYSDQVCYNVRKRKKTSEGQLNLFK